MRCVVQRVESASVSVDGTIRGATGAGIMALVGVERGDAETDVKYVADKLAGLRIFEDAQDKMNLSITDVNGAILLVSQFTLCGDARHGRRPSFSDAESPERANELYLQVAEQLRAQGIRVDTGVFQTHMKVALVNDGPVTILLDSRRRF